jgi:hypothetical protein
MVRRLIRNQLPRKGLRVRLPCPPHDKSRVRKGLRLFSCADRLVRTLARLICFGLFIPQTRTRCAQETGLCQFQKVDHLPPPDGRFPIARLGQAGQKLARLPI